jgi:hypothetical protein
VVLVVPVVLVAVVLMYRKQYSIKLIPTKTVVLIETNFNNGLVEH